MTHPILICAIALLLATTFTACDSGGSDNGGDNDVQPGTFTAAVEGQITTSLSGTAVSTGFGSTWGIVLAPGQPQTITLSTQGVGRPGPGTYVIRRNELGNPVQAGEFFGSAVLEAGPSWFVTNGSLTLNSSTATSVAGTFTFTADRFAGDGAVVTIEGSFNTTNTGG